MILKTVVTPATGETAAHTAHRPDSSMTIKTGAVCKLADHKIDIPTIIIYECGDINQNTFAASSSEDVYCSLITAISCLRRRAAFC
jgi:hypothetical protein